MESHLFDAYFLSTLGNEHVFKFLKEESSGIAVHDRRFSALQQSEIWITRRNSIQSQLLALKNEVANVDS